jgi:hypothetical protein
MPEFIHSLALVCQIHHPENIQTMGNIYQNSSIHLHWCAKLIILRISRQQIPEFIHSHALVCQIHHPENIQTTDARIHKFACLGVPNSSS